MEYIRGTNKLNNRTLKLSFKRPVRTHHYQYPYIRFIMNNIPLIAVLKLINKMIKVDTITVSGKDGYKWRFKMDEINKMKQYE